ncbi:ABC transporter permease, partial [uncultured Aureimonas sp.]|uniref:ABC transporter permease n=1 Tax=uncultured Aureimonas sp. TaxID=1604662 RepID=UPI00345B6008
MTEARSKRWLIGGLVALSLVILSAPTLVVLGASFTAGNIIAFPPDGLSLKWYAKVAGAADLRQAFWRSLQVALICTAIAIPVGTLAGLALAKYRVRFAGLLQVYLLLPFTIPLIGSGIGLMLLFGEAGVLGSLWPVGVAACVINLPFMIWIGGAPHIEAASSRSGSSAPALALTAQIMKGRLMTQAATPTGQRD